MIENEYITLINNILSPEFEEQREILRKHVKNNYIYKMRNVSTRLLNNIKPNMINHKESINLLFQAKYTIKNIHALLNRKQFVDANALLRSAFENTAMAMAIDSDEDVYNEFIDLSIDDSTRIHTNPGNIIKIFRKVFKNLDSELIGDISNTMLKKIFDDFYDHLCNFAHSSSLVNFVIEFQKHESIDMFISLFKIDVYFLETVIYLCAKKIAGSEIDYINLIDLILGYYILQYDIISAKIDPAILEKYKEIFHFEENLDFIKKETQKINNLLK